MTIVEFHGRFANTAMYYFLALALWGYWRFIRKQGVDSSYWGAMVIAQVLITLQISIGTYMWVIGLRPGRSSMHIIYGIVTMMALPAAYMYTKGYEGRADMLMYATTALIATGLVLRCFATGLPV